MEKILRFLLLFLHLFYLFCSFKKQFAAEHPKRSGCFLLTVYCFLTRAPLAPCHLSPAHLSPEKQQPPRFTRSDCFPLTVYCFLTRAPLAPCHLFTCHLSPEKSYPPGVFEGFCYQAVLKNAYSLSQTLILAHKRILVLNRDGVVIADHFKVADNILPEHLIVAVAD